VAILKNRGDIVLTFGLNHDGRRCAMEEFFHQCGDTSQISTVISPLEVVDRDTTIFAEMGTKVLRE
jgi:hypothetical protein